MFLLRLLKFEIIWMRISQNISLWNYINFSEIKKKKKSIQVFIWNAINMIQVKIWGKSDSVH